MKKGTGTHSSDTLAAQIHYAILMLQRRIRREFSKAPSLLGAQETIALLLISTVPNPIIKDLIPHLHIHQTGASRLFSYLRDEGYVEFAPNPTDARAKLLRYTSKGEKLLARLKSDVRTISDRIFQPLTVPEHRLLSELMHRLADGLGAPADSGMSGDHVTEPARRRLTIAMGLVAPEYMTDSGMDIAEYQLLLELHGRAAPVRIGELQKLLPFDPSKLSRSLVLFGKKRLLRIMSDPKDKRGSLVEFNAKGRAFFSALHERLTERFERALAELSTGERKKLHELLVKSALQTTLDKGCSIRKCTTVQDQKAARAFLVEQLVVSDQHRDLPALLLPPEDDTFIFERGDEICALAALQRGSPDVMVWFVRDARLEAVDMSTFLNALFTEVPTDAIYLQSQPRFQLPPTSGFVVSQSDGILQRRGV